MNPDAHEKHSRQALVLKAVLLALWFAVSFVTCFFARDLQFTVAGWPLHYWIAAQGAVLVFIAIVAYYAWALNRMERADEQAARAVDG